MKANYDSELNAVKKLVNELTDYLSSIEWDEANVREILRNKGCSMYTVPYLFSYN